jgi:hypothetical protein
VRRRLALVVLGDEAAGNEDVFVTSRSGTGAWTAPAMVQRTRGDAPAISFVTYVSSEGPPTDMDGTRLRVALGPGGRYLVSWMREHETALGDLPLEARMVHGTAGCTWRARGGRGPVRTRRASRSGGPARRRWASNARSRCASPATGPVTCAPTWSAAGAGRAGWAPPRSSAPEAPGWRSSGSSRSTWRRRRVAGRTWSCTATRPTGGARHAGPCPSSSRESA